MPMKKPPHPGNLIRTEVIEVLGLSVSKAAEILQVRRATLSDLLNGKVALTPGMALRIEKAFGPEMDHLLRMQLAYDVAKTRGRRGAFRSNGMRRREGLAHLTGSDSDKSVSGIPRSTRQWNPRSRKPRDLGTRRSQTTIRTRSQLRGSVDHQRPVVAVGRRRSGNDNVPCHSLSHMIPYPRGRGSSG